MGEISEVQRAYAAGFFDGDGTIHLTLQQGDQLKVTVSITQKDRPQLEWMVNVFGGNIVRERDRYWRWTPSSKEVFLRAIAPYLVMKKERVDRVLVGYYDVAALRYGSRGLPEGEMQKRRDLIEWYKTTTLARQGKSSTL